MTTVRQTVTTVQSSHGGPAPGLDNSLDALLEDLQSSVAARGGSGGGAAPAVNGLASYRREVTRTLERDGSAPRGGVQQVMHLAPANPTTVVAERAASPMHQGVSPGDARSVSYKTYSYQTYHTSAGGNKRSVTLPAAPPPPSPLTASDDATSDARLQQNLNELDSLLVDLRHAQRAGFDPPPPAQPIGSSATTRTTVVTTSGGIDPGLLEPLGHSTPAPPARQQTQPYVSTPKQQHVSRALEYNTYRTERYTSSSADGRDHFVDSPRLQPKRSSSAQRELVYGVGEHSSRPRPRSPSPGFVQRQVYAIGELSNQPRTRSPSPVFGQRQSYGEHVSRQRTRSPSPGTPQRREYVEARDRYREKSPSLQRLQREVHYNENTTTTSSGGGSRSGSMGRKYREPSPPAQPRRAASPIAPQPPGADYPGGGSRTVTTTVRTYNYSGGGGSPAPGGGGGGGERGRSPSPSSTRPPYRSPSPVSMSRPPFQLSGEDPPRGRSPSPGPRTHTSVHTYTYDGHGGGPPHYHPPSHNTVTTYKYSSNNSSGGPHRYPTPEEVQPLLPRPFPTPSPTPPGTQSPPKRLEDLMASFPEAEREPPGNYFRQIDRTVTSSSRGGHGGPVAPTAVPAPPAPPAANGVGPNAAAVVAASDAKAKEAKEAQSRAPTTNVAGTPVYYPPGVEMFVQKEEASAMQVGGGKAKAKGKYKYEYESKEKSKSSQSQRTAVVPVCLPLCCAMPCVIL